MCPQLHSRPFTDQVSPLSMQDTVPLDSAVLSHPRMVRRHNAESIFADGDYGVVTLAAAMGVSRCYRLRAEKFEQLTHDHSLLQEQIDSGQLTPEQAKYSLNKNLVTRALGIEAIVPADIAEYRLEADDIYLLCSDGLTDMVEPAVVHNIVEQKRADLKQAAADLIDLANANGGRDNISVILIHVPDDFLPSSNWAQRWLARKKAS